MRIELGLGLGLLAAAATGGCRPRAVEEVPPRVASPETPSRSVGRHDRPPTPAREPAHPLEMLPPSTQGVIVASSPARLLQVLALPSTAAKHPTTFDEWNREVVPALGFDPLDPAELPRLGIDPTGPCGIALLDAESGAFAFFATLAREATLLELVERLVPSATRARRGEAQIVGLDPEATLVVRSGFVSLIVVDHVRDDTPDFVEMVATGDGGTALPHSEAWRAARAPLPTDADLVGFFDIAKTARRAMTHARRVRARVETDLAREVAQARARGASAQEIADLERMIQDRRQRAVQEAAEAARLEHVLERLFGSIEGIAFAVSASPDGLLGSLHVALSETAPWRTVLRTEPDAPAALGALGDPPVLVGSAAVDVDALVGIVDQIMQVEGHSFDDLRREIEREAGIDLVGIMRPLFDGRASGALTLHEADAGPALADLEKAIGGYVAIGVTDPVRAAAVLDTLAAFLRPTGIVKSLPGGGHRFTIDHGPTIDAATVGGSIVATTDPDQLERIRTGKPGPGIDAVSPAALREPLVRGGATMRLGMHHALPVALVLGIAGAFDHHGFEDDPLARIGGEFPGLDVDRLRRSSATKRAQKRFERARAARKKAREALDRVETAQRMAAMHRLGTTYGHVREVPTGLVAEGGHYVEGGPSAYLDAMLDLAELGRGDLPERRDLDRAHEREDAAKEALLEALRADAVRAGATPAPTTP